MNTFSSHLKIMINTVSRQKRLTSICFKEEKVMKKKVVMVLTGAMVCASLMVACQGKDKGAASEDTQIEAADPASQEEPEAEATPEAAEPEAEATPEATEPEAEATPEAAEPEAEAVPETAKEGEGEGTEAAAEGEESAADANVETEGGEEKTDAK